MPIEILALEEWVAQSSNIAQTQQRAAEYEAAESQYRALMPWANRRQRGVLSNNLAMLLRDQARLEEALSWMEQSLAIRRDTYGEQHPETWLAVSNLALIHVARGDWKEAGRLFRLVLAQRRQAQAVTADCLVNAALAEQVEGRFSQALDLLEQALVDHPPESSRSLATLHNNIGSLMMEIGKLKQARPHFEAALRLIDDRHPSQAQIWLNLANLELALGQPSAARHAIEQAEGIERKVFAANHPRHQARETLLAWVEWSEGRWEAAEQRVAHLPEAFELRARIAMRRKNENEAVCWLEKAIHSRFVTKASLTLYAGLMRKQERFAEAAQAEQRLANIETRTAMAAYRDGSASRR